MIQDKIYDALKESAFLYLDDFMNISLRDEEHGYYTSNKAIGKDGDFIPTRQLMSRNGNIYETVIKLDQKDSLRFDFIKPRPDISKFVKNMQDLKHLEVIEFSPETNSIFRELINFLLMNNGFFLLIDYGYINLPKISTLQSIKSNKKTDFLDNPGNQDITYHVDFNNLQNILEENKIDDFIINTQSNFLRQNGILDRANILIKKNPMKKKQISEQLAILTKREYMGNLFKVLEINI